MKNYTLKNIIDAMETRKNRIYDLPSTHDDSINPVESMSNLLANYYMEDNYMSGVIIAHIALTLTRSKLKHLIDNPSTYKPYLETLRNELSVIAPYGKYSMFEYPIHFSDNVTSKTESNTVIYDVISSGIMVLTEYYQSFRQSSIYGYHGKFTDTFTEYVDSSMWYSNGHEKPCDEWKVREVNALQMAKLAIGKAISDHKPATTDPLMKDISNGNGSRYAKCNSIEIALGGGDVSELIAKYTEGLTVSELQVFNHLYVHGDSRPETARKLHISENAVNLRVNRIKEKIIAKGLVKFATSGIDTKVSDIVYAKDMKTGEKWTFTTLKECCKVLAIDTSSAKKCISGKRKTANGYIVSRDRKVVVTGKISMKTKDIVSTMVRHSDGKKVSFIINGGIPYGYDRSINTANVYFRKASNDTIESLNLFGGSCDIKNIANYENMDDSFNQTYWSNRYDKQYTDYMTAKKWLDDFRLGKIEK